MMETLRDRIVDVATEKFFRYGFSSVTTDEIAGDLGMSKKTLYEHFRSKRDILDAVIDRFTTESELQIKGITLDSSLDFPRKLELLLSLIATRISRIRQPLVRDIRKYAPDLWERIQSFRRKHVIHRFGDLIIEGVSAGQVRRDVDPTILLLILTNLLDSVMNPEVLAEMPYSTGEVFDAVMDTFFAGILSTEARDRYIGSRPTDNR